MIKLYSLENGKEFRYGGISWIKLSENEDGEILAITKELIEDRAFDEEGSNNWQESSLRKYLNDTFLNRLIKEGANKKDFLKITQSLRADDGTDEYGKTTDLISLLTDEQYRYYRNLLPKVDNWYWLITPYSCDPSSSYYVRGVYTSGTLGSSDAYYGHDGVRPLCNLKSEILVEVDEAVEHPKHYNQGSIEAIDAIEDWELNFNLGNVIKYIARCEHKGNKLVDLEKAMFYLVREVENNRENNNSKDIKY